MGYKQTEGLLLFLGLHLSIPNLCVNSHSLCLECSHPNMGSNQLPPETEDL